MKADARFLHLSKVFEVIEPLLMEAQEAKALFAQTRRRLKSRIPIPMNKQKGPKKQPAYLTGMVNWDMSMKSSLAERWWRDSHRSLMTG